MQGVQQTGQCVRRRSRCHHSTGFYTVTSRQVDQVRLLDFWPRFRPETMNVFLKTNDDVRLGDLGVASSGLTCSSNYRAVKAVVFAARVP